MIHSTLVQTNVVTLVSISMNVLVIITAVMNMQLVKIAHLTLLTLQLICVDVIQAGPVVIYLDKYAQEGVYLRKLFKRIALAA